ncbi:hypothetical protein FNF31_02732 [Cafeteria roenbergensis]|uniref:RNase NYN domain-containing protein n=1 Tax=Cafeteria roenbergensis TaxID=33653 RepID=A0A5A8DHA2_CAFRO|nr:hypothetical protein FNF31_02732 [Cafeteria roenbergensis]KAA0164613.1 hypothetical protein FNF28_03772 [Cafeteria roenbergensis]
MSDLDDDDDDMDMDGGISGAWRAPVVVDGANVACSVGGGHHGSAEAVASAVAFFRRRGHNCFAFLPQTWAKPPSDGTRSGHASARMHTDEQDIALEMVADGRAVAVPSGADDDRFAIAYARSRGGFVVSNDQFRDHIAAAERGVGSGSGHHVAGAATGRLAEPGDAGFEPLGAGLGSWLADHRISFTFHAWSPRSWQA